MNHRRQTVKLQPLQAASDDVGGSFKAVPPLANPPAGSPCIVDTGLPTEDASRGAFRSTFQSRIYSGCDVMLVGKYQRDVYPEDAVDMAQTLTEPDFREVVLGSHLESSADRKSLPDDLPAAVLVLSPVGARGLLFGEPRIQFLVMMLDFFQYSL